MPDEARAEMERDPDTIRESLIDEASRKRQEGYANPAWVGATYLKAQAGIRYLDGDWSKLSLYQARKFQDFIVFARAETQFLDGSERQRLHGNMSSVEHRLIEVYGLSRKYISTFDRAAVKSHPSGATP